MRRTLAAIVAALILGGGAVASTAPATATEQPATVCVPSDATTKDETTDWTTDAPEGDGWTVLETRTVTDAEAYTEAKWVLYVAPYWTTDVPTGDGWSVKDTRTVTDVEAVTLSEAQYTRQVLDGHLPETSDWRTSPPEGDGWSVFNTRTVVDEPAVEAVAEVSHTDYLYVPWGGHWSHKDSGSTLLYDGKMYVRDPYKATRKHVEVEAVEGRDAVTHEEQRYARQVPVYVTETEWFTDTPGGDWTATGETRTVPVSDAVTHEEWKVAGYWQTGFQVAAPDDRPWKATAKRTIPAVTHDEQRYTRTVDIPAVVCPPGEPVDPTDPPTDPVDEPTDPVTEPTDPTDTPTGVPTPPQEPRTAVPAPVDTQDVRTVAHRAADDVEGQENGETYQALASTGTSVATIAWLAILAVAAGVLVIAAVRGRRRA